MSDPKSEYRKQWERENPPRLYPRLDSQIQVISPGPSCTDVIGTLEINARGRIAFFRADGIIISLTDDNPLDTIFAEILRRRADQDAKHGGPEHDDTHTIADWLKFIRKFLKRAEREDSILEAGVPSSLYLEDQLIHVLALATAALESSRRKRNG